MQTEVGGAFSINVGNDVCDVEIVNHIDYDDLRFIIDSLNSGRICDMNNAYDNGLEVLGSGSYGDVYGYKGYAIKKLYGDNNFEKKRCNDIQSMKDLSHLSCIPKLYAIVGGDIIIIERIFGVTVNQYCNEGIDDDSITVDESFVEKWDNALLDVISNGYSPDDLHEHNVMIEFETNRPVLVDLGWFHKHGMHYDTNDKNDLRSNDSYLKANRWAGQVIRDYVDRYASI